MKNPIISLRRITLSTYIHEERLEINVKKYNKRKNILKIGYF